MFDWNLFIRNGRICHCCSMDPISAVKCSSPCPDLNTIEAAVYVLNALVDVSVDRVTSVFTCCYLYTVEAALNDEK